jgi:putative ABC transport system substrate-binding protein
VVGGAALWPLAGHAQQAQQKPRVGVLVPYDEKDPVAHAGVNAFSRALAALGWIDDRNIRVDYRFAANDAALFQKYAAELVGLSPQVILASTPPPLKALQQQTSTIPIVFVLVADPVGLGLVQSLARPGGNITGFGAVDPPIVGKWLQLLKDVDPAVSRVAVIFNPDTQPYADFFDRAIEAAAPSFGVTITIAPVRDDAVIEEVAHTQGGKPGGGLICLPDSFSNSHRVAISAVAAVTVCQSLACPPDLVRAGGLMSYWYDAIELHAQAASGPAPFLLFERWKHSMARLIGSPPITGSPAPYSKRYKSERPPTQRSARSGPASNETRSEDSPPRHSRARVIPAKLPCFRELPSSRELRHDGPAAVVLPERQIGLSSPQSLRVSGAATWMTSV